MLYIGSSQATGVYLSSSIVAAYIGSTLFWPVAATYTLRNLVVHYSSGDALHPNCGNYSWLTATLVTTWGDQSSSTTVTLNPSITTANDLYVISGTNITANTTKKKTEYSMQSTMFTGTYTIDGQTLSVTSGTTASSVLLQANVKTTTAATQTTTKVEAYLDSETLPYTADCSTFVTCTRTYNQVNVRYDWTSGEHEGGDTSTGLIQTNVVPNSISASPSTGRSISGNVITLTANNSTSERSWNVTATIDNVTSTNTCVLTQRPGQYAYGSVSVSISYAVIDASGGDVYPSVSYSQTYGWAPATSGIGTITTGGTVTYYVNGVESSTNGKVHANSMGSDPYPSIDGLDHGREVAELCYVTVSLNNKTGESSHVSVYQAVNEIIDTSANVTITIGGVAKTEYTVGPQDASYSFDATSYRTYTWTSNAHSNETKLKSALTITKSGTWITLTNAGFSTSENTSNYSKTGSITVKDGSYGQAVLSLTQTKVEYEFEMSAPQMTSFSIAYNDTSFTISVVSTRNGKPYAISASNVTIGYGSTISNLTKSVAPSDLDPTIYVATFSCSSNSATSTKSATITIKQPTTNDSFVYTVTQGAYVAATISTSVSYVAIGTTGGSSGSFSLTANKNWSIDTNFAMCDYDGDSLGNDSAAIVFGYNVPISGGAGTYTISFSRGSWTTNSIVDIKITSENTVAHVIVVPTFSMSNRITSWSPGYQQTSTVAITTNYPSISWSGTNQWLTASGDTIAVSTNSGSSNRTGSVQATGSISGTYFGVSYSSSANSSSISVNQAYNTVVPDTSVYVLGEMRDPNDLWLSTSSTSFHRISAPKRLYITGIDVLDGQMHQEWMGTAIIEDTEQYGPIDWDGGGLLDEVGYIMPGGSGTVMWENNTAPSGYVLGSTNVIWL